jgi:hypothetical protein
MGSSAPGLLGDAALGAWGMETEMEGREGAGESLAFAEAVMPAG